MKAVENAPEPKKVIVDEIDFLRLQKVSDEVRLLDAAIAEIRIQQQMAQLKMGMCDLTKQNLHTQCGELALMEKNKHQEKESLSLNYRTTAEVEFKKKYEIPENARYGIDQNTRELKIDLPN